MRVQDFNHASNVPPGASASASGLDAGEAAAGPHIVAADSREQTEITLLKKRIEHLELVVETARSLMTSNQERLLRRLHDLPQELIALSTALHRLEEPDSFRVTPNDTHATASAPARRVA